MSAYLITAERPLAGAVLPAATCVATITGDPALLGGRTPESILKDIANKLGLVHYTILYGAMQELPGYQYELFQS